METLPAMAFPSQVAWAKPQTKIQLELHVQVDKSYILRFQLACNLINLQVMSATYESSDRKVISVEKNLSWLRVKKITS